MMHEVSEVAPKVTKLCRHCKMEIPQDAKVCPYCRKKQKRSILKWILITILVLFLLFCAFCALVIGLALSQTSREKTVSSSQSVSAAFSEPESASQETDSDSIALESDDDRISRDDDTF